MTDIAERLRDWQDYEPIKKFASGLPPDLEEAVAEIERLQKDNKHWQVVASQGITIERELRVEIERLRGENERLRGHIYASNRPQPEEVERLRSELDLCERRLATSEELRTDLVAKLNERS